MRVLSLEQRVTNAERRKCTLEFYPLNRLIPLPESLAPQRNFHAHENMVYRTNMKDNMNWFYFAMKCIDHLSILRHIYLKIVAVKEEIPLHTINHDFSTLMLSQRLWYVYLLLFRFSYSEILCIMYLNYTVHVFQL